MTLLTLVQDRNTSEYDIVTDKSLDPNSQNIILAFALHPIPPLITEVFSAMKQRIMPFSSKDIASALTEIYDSLMKEKFPEYIR